MKKSIFMLSLAAVLSFGSFSAFAQNNQQNQQCCSQAKEFALTDAQKNQIKTIKQKEDKQMLPIDNQIREKKAHLNTLRTADKPDMNQINSTVEEIGKLKIEKAKIHEASHQEIRKVLTDEQRLQFDKKGGHYGKKHHGKQPQHHPQHHGQQPQHHNNQGGQQHSNNVKGGNNK